MSFSTFLGQSSHKRGVTEDMFIHVRQINTIKDIAFNAIALFVPETGGSSMDSMQLVKRPIYFDLLCRFNQLSTKIVVLLGVGVIIKKIINSRYVGILPNYW